MKITLALPDARYLPDLQRCASDSRVSDGCNVPHPYPEDGAEKWMIRTLKSTAEKKNAVFVVLSDGAFCGLMSLNAIDWGNHSAELDYWIAGDCQGKGIGTEAAFQVIERARDDLSLRVLFSACLTTNPASSRVLEKNGFRELGRFLNDGVFGRKFLHREMRRFRRDLTSDGQIVPDRHTLRFLEPS